MAIERWAALLSRVVETSRVEARARASLFVAIFRPLAHELNNPLQSLLGTVELAALAADPPGEAMHYAREDVLSVSPRVAEMQRVARGEAIGPSTWAATWAGARRMAEVLAHHAGHARAWAAPALPEAANLAANLALDATAAQLELIWLALVFAHAGRSPEPVRVEPSARGALLSAQHRGEALELDAEIRALIEALGWSWVARRGQWSLDCARVEG